MIKKIKIWHFIVVGAASVWLVTKFIGEPEIERRIFIKEIHEKMLLGFQANHGPGEKYPYRESDYYKIEDNDNSPIRYPAYSISTWSPFPLVVVGDYHLNLGPTQSSSARRVYLWLLGPIAEFSEIITGAS